MRAEISNRNCPLSVSLQVSNPLDAASWVVYKTAALPVRAVHTRQLWSSDSAGLRAVVLRLTRATHSRRGIVWRMRGDLQRSAERPQVSLHVTAVCKLSAHDTAGPLASADTASSARSRTVAGRRDTKAPGVDRLVDRVIG
jgi:hypothetical protein